MAGFFGKASSLILQIVVVVAAVLVFSWFDPFNILAPTKLKLQNTPIQVQSIKEIGQLITAEYYGEVIASLKEVVNEKQFGEMQEFNYIVDDLHNEFKMTIEDFVEENPDLPTREDVIFQRFRDFNPELVADPLFGSYLYYIFEKIKDRNYKRSELDEKLSLSKQKTLIKRLYQNRYKWRDQLNEIQTEEFKRLKKEVVQRDAKKEYRNSRLVLIGRGWVKAGFDFGTFTERNFRYDDIRNRVHFIGLQPQIISATINPWFIPEEGVEGFEFLIAERGARLKPEYTKMVKQRCLDKLQQQAMEKQILQQSQKNAEDNLKSFFSLLMDKPVNGVYFHTDYLDYTLDVILADSIIRNEELLTIDSALVYYYRTSKDKNKREKMAGFTQKLQRNKTLIYDQQIELNSLSSTVFSLIKDHIIDSTDIIMLSRKKSRSLTDTLWHANMLDDRYFSTKADSLTTEEKLKAGQAFVELLSNENQKFCKTIGTLVKKADVAIDSVQIPEGKFNAVIRGTPCVVSLK